MEAHQVWLCRRFPSLSSWPRWREDDETGLEVTLYFQAALGHRAREGLVVVRAGQFPGLDVRFCLHCQFFLWFVLLWSERHFVLPTSGFEGKGTF